VGGFRILAIALFIGLYSGVVRNEKFRHFLRFNTMQALLLTIVVYLFELLTSLLGIVSPLSPVELSQPISPLMILVNALFLAIFAASFYSIFRSARGLYAEMPIVSEAAYVQTR
jgi:ABC-type dipeptide/oligopeptide/nickel transport system permease component